MSFLITSNITVRTCPHCGTLYAMSEELWTNYGSTKFCPNGHTPRVSISAADRIAGAEERERIERSRAETAERSNASLRGVIARMKAQNGKGKP